MFAPVFHVLVAHMKKINLSRVSSLVAPVYLEINSFCILKGNSGCLNESEENHLCLPLLLYFSQLQRPIMVQLSRALMMSEYVCQVSKRRDISFRVNRLTACLTGTERRRSVKDVVAPPSHPLTHRVVSSSAWTKQWLTRRLCLVSSLQPPTPQLPLKHVDTPVSDSSFFCVYVGAKCIWTPFYVYVCALLVCA